MPDDRTPLGKFELNACFLDGVGVFDGNLWVVKGDLTDLGGVFSAWWSRWAAALMSWVVRVMIIASLKLFISLM